MPRQEGYNTAEMLQYLEEKDMLDWGFKKPHVKCILAKALGGSQSIRSSPASQRNSSSIGSGEGAWESGRYRAVRKLGRGSFGQTWLVRDGKQGDLELALKEIQCNDLQLANMAIKESGFMIGLHHPQLVRGEMIAGGC
jgi:serine/threonine protein kinase